MGFDWDSSAASGIIGWGDSNSGSFGGGLWDSITSSASSVFSWAGDSANKLGTWAKENEGGALIIGSTIGAAGNYITQKQADKAASRRERDQFNRESARYDELHRVDPLNFEVSTDAGSVNGNAPLTYGGLLTQMQQNQDEYQKKLKGV